MRFIVSATLLAALALTGCLSSDESLEVRIAPDTYQVGNVKSPLATPVVDEVVRLKPKKVLMLMCRATLPAKIIQFQAELHARHQVTLQGIRVDQGCPT